MMLHRIRLSFLVCLFLLVGGECLSLGASQAIVISADTPVYGEPEIGAEVVATLDSGTEITVGVSTGSLLSVSLSSGEEGWIPESSIGLVVDEDGRLCLEMGFQQGVEEGLYTANFEGTGRFMGSDSLTLTAELGTEVGITLCPKIRGPFVAKPRRSSESQRMLVRSIGPRIGPLPDLSINGEASVTSGLRLGGDEPASGTFAVEAYCLDPEKSEPSDGEPLTADFSLELVNLDKLTDLKDKRDVQTVLWARLDSGEGRPAGMLCSYLSDMKPEARHALFERSGTDLEAIWDRCPEWYKT